MMDVRMLKVGVAALTFGALIAGCTQNVKPKGGKSGPAEAESHVHGMGPHGGTIADWGGGKYHIEFTVNHEKQEATVYILGKDEKTPTPIAAKDGKIMLSIKEPAFQVELKAAPQKDDPPGKASAFTGKHEKLGKEQEFAGTVTGEIDGTPFTGDFKEEEEKPGPGKK
jgi:hypothetical protein